MRLLLDTHVAVWALTDPDKISADGRALIADSQNAIYVSVVSVWEIAIKRALGRASAPPFTSIDAAQFFDESGFLSLGLTVAHASATERLPLIHRDPFDRLIIAQASLESMRLLTRDAAILAYGGSMMRV